MSSPSLPRRPRWRALAAAACVGTAGLLTGCGGSSEQAHGLRTTPAGSFTPPPKDHHLTDRAGHGPGERIVFANPNADVLRVAAGGGHVVAVLQFLRISRLVDLSGGGRPRTLATFPGRVASPEIGTGADGHPVVVWSPCLGLNPTVPPSCSLDSLDLTTGRRSTLSGTRGAMLGDVDGGRVATVTATAKGPTFAVQTAAGAPLSPLPLTSYRWGYGMKSATLTPLESNHVESIDFAHDTLAVSLLGGTPCEGGGSLLMVRRLGRPWNAVARTGYGLMDCVEVDLQAVEVTATGIRAFSSGGPESPPYVGRWDAVGHRLSRIKVKSHLGYTVTAAFAGDRLVGAASDPELGTPWASAVVSSGPYDLG